METDIKSLDFLERNHTQEKANMEDAEPGGGSRLSSLPAAPTSPTPFPVDALGRWVLRETAHVQGGKAGIEVTGLDSIPVLSTIHCARYALCGSLGIPGQLQAGVGHGRGTCYRPHSRVSTGMINTRSHLTFTITQRTRDFQTYFINES